MIFLILSIVLLSVANAFQRHSSDIGANAYGVNAISRLFSGVVAIGLMTAGMGLSPVLHAPAATITWAVVGGAFYWLAGLGAIKAYGLGHLGISSTVLRCSMVLPTLASLLVWHDVELSLTSRPMWIVLAVIALLVIGICLSGMDQILLEKRRQNRINPRWLAWLLAAFLGQGCWEITLRAAGALPTEQDRQVYLVLVFTVAMVISVATVLMMRLKPAGVDWRCGCLLGLLAMCATSLRPYAIRDLSGVVVFPMTAMGSMLVMNTISTVLWKSHLGRLGLAGLGSAALAMILMCLR